MSSCPSLRQISVNEGSNLWCLFYLFSRVDASKEDGSFGRLLNDNHIHPNCRPKVMEIDERPVICFFSVRPLSSVIDGWKIFTCWYLNLYVFYTLSNHNYTHTLWRMFMVIVVTPVSLSVNLFFENLRRQLLNLWYAWHHKVRQKLPDIACGLLFLLSNDNIYFFSVDVQKRCM